MEMKKNAKNLEVGRTTPTVPKCVTGRASQNCAPGHRVAFKQKTSWKKTAFTRQLCQRFSSCAWEDRRHFQTAAHIILCKIEHVFFFFACPRRLNTNVRHTSTSANNYQTTPTESFRFVENKAVLCTSEFLNILYFTTKLKFTFFKDYFCECTSQCDCFFERE